MSGGPRRPELPDRVVTRAGPGAPAGTVADVLRFVDVGPEDPRLARDLLPVLRELRPHLTPESLASVYAEGQPQGLRFTAAYSAGTGCAGVAGWRVTATTHGMRQLYVDDLVTTEQVRSQGVGTALLAELARRARLAGCTLLALDSGVQRHDAHRFYLRERMAIVSHHFARALD